MTLSEKVIQKVWRVAFSPDGNRLTTGGADGMARIFILDIDELTTLAHSRLTRSLTEAERRQYLHVEGCPGDEE